LEIDVEYVAKLANLPLDEKRLEILGKQLSETLLSQSFTHLLPLPRNRLWNRPEKPTSC